MKVIEKADVALIEPLLCSSIEAGTAIIGRSKRFFACLLGPADNCGRG